MYPLCVVLCYHRIAPVETPDPYGLCITPDAFSDHLNLFHTNYQVISLKHLLEQLRTGKREERKQIAITFDDGYADTLKHAAPLLQQYTMPATLFAFAGGIDEGHCWWDDLAVIVNRMSDIPLSDRNKTLWKLNKQLLRLSTQERNLHLQNLAQKYDCWPTPLLKGANFANWSDIRKWREIGLDVQIHGYDHLSVRDRPIEEIDDDLRHAQLRFQEEFGEFSTIFAYPFGIIDSAQERFIQDILSANNIGAAFTAEITTKAKAVELGQSFYQIPRIDVSSYPKEILRAFLDEAFAQ